MHFCLITPALSSRVQQGPKHQHVLLAYVVLKSNLRHKDTGEVLQAESSSKALAAEDYGREAVLLRHQGVRQYNKFTPLIRMVPPRGVLLKKIGEALPDGECMGPLNRFEKPGGKENPTNSEVLTSLVNHWLHDFPERIKELYGADAVVQTARSDLIGAGTRVDRVLSHVDIINALMGKQLAKHAAPPGA